MTPDDLPQRLRSKIDTAPDGCWYWTAATNGDGYGRVWWEGRQVVYAHRLVRHLLVGDVEPYCKDLRTDQLDHLCRNRSCVNPDHLEVVTCRENLVRGQGFIAAHVKKTHCPAGHPYTGANLYVRKSGGRRECRACRAASDHRRIKR